MGHKRSRLTFAASLALAFVSGCVAQIKPERLAAPAAITCVNLQEALSFTGHYGLLKVEWTTRLERGPYWSEKVDDKGTYYRAPPGGVSIAGKGGDAPPGFPRTFDGGFYIPNNPAETPRIYRYFSSADAPAEVPPDGVDCSTVAYSRDPATSKISLVSVAAAGALGGTAGGLLGRGIAQGSTLSYGQAAGVGAAGGMVGGLIVGAIINSGVGKIDRGLPILDTEWWARLRERVANKSLVNEVQLPAGAL